MACTNCSTGTKDGTPRGCKNNGTCGTDSCNKLTVFDWLSNMSLPGGEAPFDCVEVRFKNGRKEFYRNTEKLTLSIGDIVATEASPGHDIGIVTLTGELVKMQMKKKGEKPEGDVPKIYRKASQKDIDIWSESRAKEEPMKVVARELAIKLKLEMKISDIEFQGDASKATFYYTANDRVDFRQLIKDFAREFSIRIEMKQVGFRQEAARLGGIGSCGRELCCSTWLTDFRSVNTSAARYQQLSLNPQKLAGQCGKLKCCLNYELDTYLDALKGLPDMDTKLYTEKGDAFCQKVDIFKGLMWFAYVNDMAHWHVLEADQVKEIIALNKQKERVASLEDYAVELESENVAENFQNAVGQDSLTRFDKPKPKKKHKNKPKEGAGAERPSGRDNRDNREGGARPQRDNRDRPQNRDNREKGPRDNNKPQNRDTKDVANKPQNRDNRDNTPREHREGRDNNAPRENKGNRPQQPKRDNKEGGNNRPNNNPRQGQNPNAGGENTNVPQNSVTNTNAAGNGNNRNKNKRRRPSGDKNSSNDKNSPSE